MPRLDITNRISRFAADQHGNFVLLFAVLLLPMLGLLGLGVDYSLALRTKTALDAGSDAAVLAAVTEAEQIIQSYSTANFDATSTAISYGQYAGQQVFLANTAMLHTASPPTITLTLQRQGQVINATGAYAAQSPTIFGKMFGTDMFNTAGTSTSSLTLPRYMNIYVLADVSQSMGIGATQNDMTQLASLTPGNCVFGCHVPQSNQTTSNETLAHNNNVQLRIDIVRKSIKNMIASAQSMSNGSPTIKIGIYTIQNDIVTLSNVSTDYVALQSSADQIDLGPNSASGIGDSNHSTSLSDFAASLSASGDGSSVNSPQSFVFVMTDGVSDVYGSSCGYSHCTRAFDPALCSPLKAKGATVGVIYTTYIPFPSNRAYVDLVQPFAADIAPNLQSCASPGYYFEASDGPAIQDATQRLFAQATQSGRLTQ